MSYRVLLVEDDADIREAVSDYFMGIAGSEMVCGAIACDPLKLTASVNGKAVTLPRKELELLVYLMENRNRVVSRDELLTHIWGYDYDGRERVVDDHIRKLRKSLGSAEGQIKTVITKGYQIRE